MLQISHLSFSYHDQIIFQNLNLNFSASEIIAIIGDNGAGKTTLLRLIAGELIPDNGATRKNGDIRILNLENSTILILSLAGNVRAQNLPLFFVPLPASSYSTNRPIILILKIKFGS